MASKKHSSLNSGWRRARVASYDCSAAARVGRGQTRSSEPPKTSRVRVGRDRKRPPRPLPASFWTDSEADVPRRSDLYESIYEVVRKIPLGRVSTYGRVAEVAGLPGHARLVGYALHALPDRSDVPWHRVVNHMGRISARKRSSWGVEQRRRLRSEGVEFDLRGRVDLARYSWPAS